MNNIISVIIPVYNVELYLRECLDSVLSQSDSDLQVILIDDGSTDASGAICDEYAAKDSRVRTLCYDGTNADELTVAIAESGGVIATRFHAAILAITAGRSVIPILYSDKTKYVLEDLGLKALCTTCGKMALGPPHK